MSSSSERRCDDYPEVVSTGDDWSLSVGMRVALAHAAVQVLAEDCGADVLHIKGPAVDDTLLDSRPVENADFDDDSDREVVPRSSIDADVLVRPSHVPRLLNAMHSSGWLDHRLPLRGQFTLRA
jgi:hypothetical protein